MLYFTSGNNQEDSAVIQAREDFPSEDYLLFVRVSDGDVRLDEVIDRLQIKESDAHGVFLVAKNGS